MSIAHRVRVHSIETLSDNWYILRKATFDFLRSDGTWQRQARAAYDRGSPEETIRREAMEETGYEIHDVKKIFDVFMSPGSVTERVYFFVAEYHPAARQERGGGLHSEGEDIDTLEMDFDDAYQKIHDGVIRDGKTIMLLQHAKLHIFP